MKALPYFETSGAAHQTTQRRFPDDMNRLLPIHTRSTAMETRARFNRLSTMSLFHHLRSSFLAEYKVCWSHNLWPLSSSSVSWTSFRGSNPGRRKVCFLFFKWCRLAVVPTQPDVQGVPGCTVGRGAKPEWRLNSRTVWGGIYRTRPAQPWRPPSLLNKIKHYMFQYPCIKQYLHLCSKHTNANCYSMLRRTLIFTDLLRSLLRPSSGCFTRMQIMYNIPKFGQMLYIVCLIIHQPCNAERLIKTSHSEPFKN
jgi:hypothetical protein